MYQAQLALASPLAAQIKLGQNITSDGFRLKLEGDQKGGLVLLLDEEDGKRKISFDTLCTLCGSYSSHT
jgi:hypothetical protein